MRHMATGELQDPFAAQRVFQGFFADGAFATDKRALSPRARPLNLQHARHRTTRTPIERGRGAVAVLGIGVVDALAVCDAIQERLLRLAALLLRFGGSEEGRVGASRGRVGGYRGDLTIELRPPWRLRLTGLLRLTVGGPGCCVGGLIWRERGRHQTSVHRWQQQLPQMLWTSFIPTSHRHGVWRGTLTLGRGFEGVLTSDRFALRRQKPQLGQIDDLGGIAIGAAGVSLERGTDLRMLWEVLGHHERRRTEGEYALESEYDHTMLGRV